MPGKLRSAHAPGRGLPAGRLAWSCYDHLAGRAGVVLLDSVLARGLLIPAGHRGLAAAFGWAAC